MDTDKLLPIPQIVKELQNNVDDKKGHHNAQHRKDVDAYAHYRSDLVDAQSANIHPIYFQLVNFEELQQPNCPPDFLDAETPAPV